MGTLWRAAKLRTALLTAAASIVCVAPAFAQQQTQSFNIPAQSTASALNEFSRQAGVQILFPYEVANRTTSQALQGEFTRDEALRRLTQGTQLSITSNDGRTIVLADTSSPTQLGATDYVVPSDSDEEIVVTGTYLRGGRSPSPVTTVTRDDIQNAGTTTVEQFLERVPQVFSGGIAEDTGRSFVPGSNENNNFGAGTGVNLRGLGTQSTLVLFNSHRVSSSGAGNFVDISQVPVAAIQRIEVLADGASATYGSDAISGVANVIFRNDLDGAEVTARVGSVTSGSLLETGANLTVGRTWERGNLLAAYDYGQRDNLSANDRDFAAPAEEDLLPSRQQHSVLVAGSQRLTDHLTLNFDGIASHRETETLATDDIAPGPVNRRDTSTSDTYTIHADLEGSVNRDWRLTLGGNVGQVQVEFDRRLLTGDPVYDFDVENTFASATLVADGTLFDLPGGPLALATGVELRNENYTNVDTGTLIQDSERSITAVFGEVRAPLISEDNHVPFARSFLLTAAVRHEDYSDVGSNTVPKFGMQWSPIEGLFIRATHGRSFRAPDFDQTLTIFNQVLLFDFPDPDFSNTSLTLFVGGAASDIRPEESTSNTIGIDWAPSQLRGLRASLTYFDIAFTDRIARPSDNPFEILANDDIFAAIITRNPTPDQIAAALAFSPVFIDATGGSQVEDTEVIIYNPRQNIASTQLRGLDFDLSYDFEVGGSSIHTYLTATQFLEFTDHLTPTSPSRDSLDTLFNPLSLKLRSGVDWTAGDMQISVSANYSPSYTNNGAIPAQEIDSWTTFDGRLAYAPQEGPLAHTTFALAVTNLFEADPPTVSGVPDFVRPVGYDPANASALGRFVSFFVSKRF